MNAAEITDFSFTAYRRDDPTNPGRGAGIRVAAAIPALVAMGFAWIGAWPITIYGTAVSLGIVAMIARGRRSGDDYERILVQGDRLLVESCAAGNRMCMEFNRCWARLVIGSVGADRGPRLWLRSHGRQIEIGWLATAERREVLAQHLRTLVGTAYGR